MNKEKRQLLTLGKEENKKLYQKKNHTILCALAVNNTGTVIRM